MIATIKSWLLAPFLALLTLINTQLLEWRLQNALNQRAITQTYEILQKTKHLSDAEYTKAFKLPIKFAKELINKPDITGTDIALYSLVVHRQMIPTEELARITEKLNNQKNFICSNTEKIAAAMGPSAKAQFLGINYIDLYTPEEINRLFIKKLQTH